jgi:hypothetical protein
MSISPDFTHVERKQLKNRKKNLIEQYEAVFSQQDIVLSEKDKIILNKQCAKLKKEIENVERELESLENSQETKRETPLYKFGTPDNFDLEELITHCQCKLRRKQGLIGLAIHYTGNYFLSNFKTRLKVALHRENVFIAPSITLSASHTTTETGVRLVKRYMLNLSQSDVLVDIVSTDQTAAERFWQKLNSVFDHQSCNRFIVIMGMEPECLFPPGFIPLNPPCCNDGHIFHWVGKIVPQLSLLPSEPYTIMNEWTDAVINECSIDGQLYIEFVYEHLEAALNKLRLNPTVPALYDFLEQRKQIYA